MYGSQTAALPATGVGTAAAYAASGPESWLFLALALFTLYAAVKTAWKMAPRFGSGDPS